MLALAARRQPPAVAASVAIALCAGSASAQTRPAPLPPPPQGDSVAPGLEPDADDRAAIDQASELLATGRPDEAQRVLQPRVARGGFTPGSYAALPVLDRLARRMALQPPSMLRDAAASSGDDRPRDDRTPGPRAGFEGFTLYAGAIVYGAFTGVWIDVMAGIDSASAAVWIPLLLGGAGAGAAYLAERQGGTLRRGRPAAMSTGMNLGAIGGLCLGIWGADNEGWDEKGVFTSTWLGATLGVGAGLALSVATDSSPAAASFVGSGGYFGAGFGLITAISLEIESEWWPITALIGEGVGVGLTAALAGTLRPATSQVRWMDLGIIAGGALGGGIAVLIFDATNIDSPLLPLTIVELGMLGGGIAGYLLGAPSQRSAASSSAAPSRFAMHPAISPTPGGAQLSLSFPNLL